MSTSASIGNFYVDYQGNEQPIRFKAADLVNKPAPTGYHWEKRDSTECGRPYNSDKRDAGFYDYYICVRDT